MVRPRRPLRGTVALVPRGLDRKENGDLAGCCACLEQVTATVDIETRHHVQAWHYLRELGRKPPPAESKNVLGIIIETGTAEGTDVVGAYEDHTARYWGPGGIGILWNRLNADLDDDFDSFFALARVAAKKIEPKIGGRPPILLRGWPRFPF